jgi:hypothetical protein
MKKLLSCVLILTATTIYAQKGKDSISTRFAIPTPAYDTLYINKDDEMGIMTKEIWEKDTSSNKPVIILVNSSTIALIERRMRSGNSCCNEISQKKRK